MGVCQATSSEQEEEEGLSAMAYHRLNGEDIVGEKHGVSLHLGSLVLEGAGQKAKAFLDSGVHRALLEKISRLVLFLPLQPVTPPAATGRGKPSINSRAIITQLNPNTIREVKSHVMRPDTFLSLMSPSVAGRSLDLSGLCSHKTPLCYPVMAIKPSFPEHQPQLESGWNWNGKR